MAFQNVVRWLLPKETQFFDYLERQAVIVHQGAVALSKFDDVHETASAVAEKLVQFEHEADAIVREFEDALARTFVTPLDREDMHKLSGDLDSVIDLMTLAARSCVLFGVTRPTEPMSRLSETLVASTRLLKDAMPKLRKHEYLDLVETGRRMRGLEKEGDAVFRHAVSRLFADPHIDAKVLLREKEVLEDLENAIDHCHYVGKILSNLAVKHG